MKKKALGGLTQATRWYRNFTTLGGFTQARDSDNETSRKYWIVILLAGLFMTTNSVKSTITRYLSYPTTWDSSVVLSQALDFPAVTVCNANKVHCGHLREYIIEKVR
jgi:hypothetical protein